MIIVNYSVVWFNLVSSQEHCPYTCIGPLHFESTRVGAVARVLVVQIQQFMIF